ncbi:MAG TPA: hypothetical protein DDY41_06990 [Arthrobacter bacterium]|jgi:hypothetical protein|nr:hypothetical protein [Arthrobacter sp.]
MTTSAAIHALAVLITDTLTAQNNSDGFVAPAKDTADGSDNLASVCLDGWFDLEALAAVIIEAGHGDED